MRNIFKFLGLIFYSFHVFATTLTQIQVENQTATFSQIQCQLTPGFHFQTFILHQPERVVLDLTPIQNVKKMNLGIKGQGIIQKVRQGQPKSGTLRLVFDVHSQVYVKTTASQHTLVLQLSTSSTTPKIKKSLVPPTPLVSASVSSKKKPIMTQSTGRGARDVIIVLDPGHGGHDPGAIGPSHRIEKNVTLAIAKALKSLIDKEPGMKAILTRNGDYYVGLRERLNIARKYNADVFISIHADAFIHAHSHGASVFALSQRGATSEAARWLAEKENYSELGGVNLKHLDDKNGVIRSVLLDLSQTATINSSLQLGTQVLQNLGQMTTLHNKRVEQARFVVLKSPDTPSILVETGFISNPQESNNLSNPYYQMRLAKAVVLGLKNYFWAHPPHGTRLEYMANAPKSRWLFGSLRGVA